MNKTDISWKNNKEGWELTHTWNPVVGCKHGCYYCYAKKLNDRFKWIKRWNRPKLFKDRLQEPFKKRKPIIIFVGSMCDLFGNWIPRQTILNIITIAERCPQHKFLFLTKNPARYLEFKFADNCWLGCTLTREVNFFIEIMNDLAVNNHTFISIEPLLGSFKNAISMKVDWIIVGAMTGHNAVVPQQEWIESIKHDNIYYKPSIYSLVD